MTCCLPDWLIDWLIDWLMSLPIVYNIEKRVFLQLNTGTDWVLDLIVWFKDHPIGWLICWSNGCLIDWVINWMIHWLIGSETAWSIDWLYDLLSIETIDCEHGCFISLLNAYKINRWSIWIDWSDEWLKNWLIDLYSSLIDLYSSLIALLIDRMVDCSLIFLVIGWMIGC